MVLGYDEKRPTAEDYHNFERKITEGVKRLEIDGLSLMLYGSYIRGDFNPGRSDIDGVFIFPDDVVINKQNLHRASSVLHQALTGNPVPFQVTVNDITTLRDGRFNHYDSNFRAYFDEEARITGVDYREQMTYELPTMSDQIPLRFNLRKTRAGLLFAVHDINEDYLAFLNRFNKSLDAVSRSSKQILYFVDGSLRKNRFSAIQAIKDIFPEIDTDPLSRIKKLYQDLGELDRLYQKSEEVMGLWNSAVTFMEEIIRAYIKRFPKKSE